MFRILHFSDLHARIDKTWSTDALLAAAKDTLLAEHNQQNIDLLAFTGDIAYSGRQNEYDIAGSWIDEFCVSSSGLNLEQSRLLFVPGNHDVNRNDIPHLAGAIEESLAKSLSQDDAAKYLDDAASIKALLQRHTSYAAFCEKVRGDSLLTLPSWTQVIDIPLGTIVVEGYCSSWLSSSTPDKNRLLVGQPQITDCVNARPNHDCLIAMVHHPPSHLMEFDESNFESHLRAHHALLLRGHLHKPDATYKQSASGSHIELAAGALHHRFEFPNSFNIIDLLDDFRSLRVKVYMWSQNRWTLDRNIFIDSPDGIGRLSLPARPKAISRSQDLPPAPSFTIQHPSNDEQTDPVDQQSTARIKLAGFAQYKVDSKSQDRAIRLQFLEDALVAAESPRIVEIQSEWGADSNGFISSLIERLRETQPEIMALHARCGGLLSGEQLQAALALTSNLSLPDLAANLQQAGPCAIVLDDMGAAIDAAGDEHNSLRETVNTFLDYCPELVFVSNLPVSARIDDASSVTLVRIGPLDAADTRQYMMAHDSRPPALQSIVNYDRVHRATGGLPGHIDKVVLALQYTDLSGALAEFNEETRVIESHLPNKIVEQIEQLAVANDDNSTRARLLLHILSILERGELLSVVKRLIPTIPIWPTNAKTLQDCGLLDVIDTSSQSHHATHFAIAQRGEKVLRIPRVVRDHVLKELPPETQQELIVAAATLYFGASWRDGSVRMRRRPDMSPIVTAYRFSNEMLILRFVTLTFRKRLNLPSANAFALLLSYVA